MEKLTSLSINNKEKDFYLDLKGEENFFIPESQQINILIKEIDNDSSLNLNVAKNSVLKISILAKESFNNLNLKVDLHENSSIDIYFADFSINKNKAVVNINLLEENASCSWKLSSLTSKNDQKEFSVYINHLHSKTYALSDNYGVCKDDAKLIFSGTSHIVNGASLSKTKQNAKIMVFDEKSNAIAKPILKIDEHDIVASHAAIVGKINDEHLFYLTSRGLKENEAKQLITYGYLKPILLGFNQENIKEQINNLIEGRM